jgi:hypothetical protein
LGLVAFRHTHWGKRSVPALLLAPAGAVVGLLSALTGSVGVRLKISAVSTPLKWLRLAVYWIARFRHDLQPEEQL